MDTEAARQFYKLDSDFDWEGFHRRDNPLKNHGTDPSLEFPQDILEINEDTGDDERRRERMAEAMYEC